MAKVEAKQVAQPPTMAGMEDMVVAEDGSQKATAGAEAEDNNGKAMPAKAKGGVQGRARVKGGSDRASRE